MHKLLQRQFARNFANGTSPSNPREWEAFVAKVNEAYERADADRGHLERSLDLASDELLSRNASLKQELDHHQQAELEARRAASLLEATLEGTTDGILVVDRAGRVITHNQGYLDIWGFAADETSSPLETRVKRAMEKLADTENLVERVKTIMASAMGESHDTLLFRDGRVCDRVSRPQLLNGEPIGRVWSFRDVTQAHRAARALADSESRLRALVEGISDIVSIMDLDGTYTYVSPSVERVLGYAPDEVVGRNVRDFVHDDDLPIVGERFDDPSGNGERQPVEFRALHKDGSLRILESLRVDARDRPGVGGYLGVSRDVTEKRRLEAEAQAHQAVAWRRERLSALGTLVAGVAHEINNPLSYIISNLEFAISDLDAVALVPPREDKHAIDLQITARGLRTAVQGVDRIARITRALKAVAKQGALRSTPIDVGKLLIDATALIETALPQGVQLRTSVPAEALLVEGDPAELHQVILNLGKNAVDAVGTQGGSVHLVASIAGESVEMRVEDDGPGIPLDVQPRLFTPFFTTKPDGTGLGLSITHAIVERHRGVILVDSSTAGTTVTVRLPRLPPLSIGGDGSA